MEPATFTVALPDEPELLSRLIDAVAAHADPPINVVRLTTAVLSFECATWDTMLRSRVMQALEAVLGPDWQSAVRTIG